MMMMIHLSFRMEREVGRNRELFIGHVRERKTDFNFFKGVVPFLSCFYITIYLRSFCTIVTFLSYSTTTDHIYTLSLICIHIYHVFF